MSNAPINYRDLDMEELHSQVDALVAEIQASAQTIESRMTGKDESTLDDTAHDAATDAAVLSAEPPASAGVIEKPPTPEPDPVEPAPRPEAPAKPPGESIPSPTANFVAEPQMESPAPPKKRRADEPADGVIIKQDMPEPTPEAEPVADPELPEPEGAAPEPPADIEALDETLAREADATDLESELGPEPAASEIDLSAPPAPELPAETRAPAPPADAAPESPAPRVKDAPEPEPAAKPIGVRAHTARLSEIALRVAVVLNRPLSRVSPTVRDTIGWIALNTLFIAVCVWAYLLLR